MILSAKLSLKYGLDIIRRSICAVQSILRNGISLGNMYAPIINWKTSMDRLIKSLDAIHICSNGSKCYASITTNIGTNIEII